MNDQNASDSVDAVGPFVTFACGAVAGAAVALMLAPTTGRDARALVAHQSRRVADKGREMVHQHGALVADILDGWRDTAFAFGERIGQALEQGKAGYRDAIRQGQGLAGNPIRIAEGAARAVGGPASANTSV